MILKTFFYLFLFAPTVCPTATIKMIVIGRVCVAFFWFGGILGSASRAEFIVSPSSHVGFTPRLLYSSTHHSSESIIPLKTG